MPALRNHRRLPFVSSRDHFRTGAAHFRLKKVAIQSELEAQFPAELMAADHASRFDMVLSHHEQLAEVHGRAMPLGPVENIHREKFTLFRSHQRRPPKKATEEHGTTR